jgi:isohexenylglutaconyl-CoA hydratase
LKTALARMAQPIVPGEPDPVMVDNRNAGALFQSLNSHPQTTIAIVDGPAFGGGFGLACCADIVICTGRARFALSETGLGLPPAQIAPYVVSRLGLRTTRRLALTGLRFDGREAAAIGLADYFCETAEALDTTLAMLLNGIGRCAPGANAVTKDLLLSLSPAGGDAYLDRAAAAFAACLRSAEGQEGVAAFNGKRAAHWVDDLS